MPGLVRLSGKRRSGVVFAGVPGMGTVGPGRMRAKRVDANHAEIKRAFERLGCDVLDLSGVGRDCPDLLVRVRAIDRWMLVEVKTPKGRIRPGQAAFAERWPVQVVRSVDDAMAAVLA